MTLFKIEIKTAYTHSDDYHKDAKVDIRFFEE